MGICENVRFETEIESRIEVVVYCKECGEEIKIYDSDSTAYGDDIDVEVKVEMCECQTLKKEAECTEKAFEIACKRMVENGWFETVNEALDVFKKEANEMVEED